MSNLSPNLGIFSPVGNAVPLAGGKVYFVPAFGNVSVVISTDGVLLFDIGTRTMGDPIFRSVRAVTNDPIRYIVYSHGHFDHCFGYAPFQAEWQEQGWAPPAVVAHENVPRRFEKYRMLGPYHAWINGQQFGSLLGGKSAHEEDAGDAATAMETLDPTILVNGWDPYVFSFGEHTIELHPAWGETDDVLWMYVPESGVICTGDLFLWSFPNVGNPFKVQRYPKHWAQALEEMLPLDAQYLLPGHGPLIEGREQVREALSVTAEALNFVHDGVIERLNEGKWFEDIYWEMMDLFPAKFRESQYLQPVYGCYQFAIHATYRLYHGWYDTGNPTDLFPARRSAIAREVLHSAGTEAGSAFFQRAQELASNGDNQMALHMLDFVIQGTEDLEDPVAEAARALKVKLLKQLAKVEPSFIARNIYLSAARRLQKSL
jgi:alkyl sulfatase BDS1-like metallo-beta-lactamase superfamily hydrolase